MSSKIEKYYLLYVENCEIKILEFVTKNDLDEFKLNYMRKIQDSPDNWIMAEFKGFLLEDYESMLESGVQK